MTEPAAFRRSRSQGWIFAAIAAVFAIIAIAITVEVGRLGLDQLLHPVILLLVGVPLAIAVVLGSLALRALRRQPVVVAFDENGVTLGSGPVIGWAEIRAVVVTTIHLGYGPRKQITFRRRVPPSDIAAKGAERLVHNLFTDRSFAPSLVDRSAEDMLAEIDRWLAEAGLRRDEPPRRRFQLVQSAERWEIRPADTRP